MQPPIYRDTLVPLYEPWYLIIVMISCSFRHSLPPPASMHLKILTSLFLCSSAFSCLPTFDARSWKRESERKCVWEKEREPGIITGNLSLSCFLSLTQHPDLRTPFLPCWEEEKKSSFLQALVSASSSNKNQKKRCQKISRFFPQSPCFSENTGVELRPSRSACRSWTTKAVSHRLSSRPLKQSRLRR